MSQTFSEPILTCVNHPTVETSLRCNRCNDPICSKCAVHTPTGYKCRTCVRGQQKVFETALWHDYPIGMILGLVFGLVGALIVPSLGFFTIFLAPVAGTITGEVVRLAIRRRRSRRLFIAIAASVAFGALLPLVSALLVSLLSSRGFGFGLWSLLWQGLYAFIVTSTVYARLSGFQIRR